jgi:AcrR family transcriptional regulator
MVEVADRLNVSRATLYRTVRTKQELLGILLVRETRQLYSDAQEILRATSDPSDQLQGLIRLLVSASIQMRHYTPVVFFGSGGVPDDAVAEWLQTSRKFESLWVDVVRAAMDLEYLAQADPVVTARLLLGQCIWVSRWYRPQESYDAESIAEAAIGLLPWRSTTRKRPRPTLRAGAKPRGNRAAS